VGLRNSSTITGQKSACQKGRTCGEKGRRASQESCASQDGYHQGQQASRNPASQQSG